MIKNKSAANAVGIFTGNEDPNWGLARFKESFGAQGVFRDSLRGRIQRITKRKLIDRPAYVDCWAFLSRMVDENKAICMMWGN